MLRNIGRRAAIVILGDSATREHFLRCRPVDEYVRAHHRSWFRYAHAAGFDLTMRDIIFVTGHVKTSKWALAVMKSREGHRALEFTVGPSSSSSPLSIAPHISAQEQGMSVATRSGPNLDALSLTSVVGDLPKNQCIFLEYYKLEPRRWGILPARYRQHPEAQDADIVG